MSLTIDGNSLVFDGTVTVSNATNPTTGVCTLILTPSGGVGSLPALLAGTPGLPPTITVSSVTTLSPGAQATFTLTQTDAGGAGTASAYTAAVGIPQGQTGTSGTVALSASTDLSGTAVVGDTVMVSSISPTAFSYTPLPFGNAYNVTTFASVSTSGQVSATVAPLSIPAQPTAYIPIAFASCTAVGTASTLFTLSVVEAANSDVVGLETAVYAGSATQRLRVQPSFGGLLSGGYGQIAAGTAATFNMIAQQTAGVSDAWTISNSTMAFTIFCLPVS